MSGNASAITIDRGEMPMDRQCDDRLLWQRTYLNAQGQAIAVDKEGGNLSIGSRGF